MATPIRECELGNIYSDAQTLTESILRSYVGRGFYTVDNSTRIFTMPFESTEMEDDNFDPKSAQVSVSKRSSSKSHCI